MTPETIVEVILNSLNLQYEKEFRFDVKRKFRFDYFIPELSAGIEIEGAVFTKSRHTTGTGYSKDCEKYNLAQINGYKVLRYTTTQIKTEPMKIEQDLRDLIYKGDI